MSAESQLDRARNTLWAEVNRYIRRTVVPADGDVPATTKPGFIIDEHNQPVLRDLANWMVGAPCQWLEPGIGVGLAGPVGTFKTDMMSALSRALVRGGGQGFGSISALTIEKLYSRSSKDENQNGGTKVILKYGRMEEDLCIHDIGEEPIGMHFGVACDVIGEIFSLRNELWKLKGIKTHLTTNIVDDDGLRVKYDPRTARRILEQVRMMPLGGPDRSDLGLRIAMRYQSVELFQDEPAMPSEQEMEEDRARAAIKFKEIRNTIAEARAAMDTEVPKRPTTLTSSASTSLSSDIEKLQQQVLTMTEPELVQLRAKYTANNKNVFAIQPFLDVIDAELAKTETAGA